MLIPRSLDLDATHGRIVARKSRNGEQARWLLAFAAIYEGASRTQASQISRITLQIIRDWVLKFNAATLSD